MDQHISGWRKPYSLDNRYSLRIQGGIRYTDHRNILGDKSMNQLQQARDRRHLRHKVMENKDAQALHILYCTIFLFVMYEKKM